MTSELSTELSRPVYANLSDQEAADLLNAKVISVQQSVPIHNLKQYAIFQGIWPKLKAGRNSQTASVAAVCTSIIDWIEDARVQSVDVAIAEVQTMIGALVAAEIMTQQQADEIIAMGIIQMPWAQSIGYQEIGIGLVRNARKELNAE